jgi:hypothetical protein
MTRTASVYDEIAVFMVGMNPEKVIAFKLSDANQARLNYLLDVQKESPLNLEEKSELEHFLIVNRIVSLAKVRAIKMMEA